MMSNLIILTIFITVSMVQPNPNSSPINKEWKFQCYDKNIVGGSPGELSEELVMQEKQKKGWRMNCDLGEATKGLENELWRR